MGTNMHGQSLMFDPINGSGLKHNQSIEQQQSPAHPRSKKSGLNQEVIKEETEGNDRDSKKSKKFQSVMSGQNLRSDKTLNQQEAEYGSEMTSNQLSPSLKSLMKSKHGQQQPESGNQLKDSIKQNNRKVKGATSIKNLIRSAATRH
mmetsp:Transcript_6714/g.10792  ORF Transcript_6714/g.10792 Transcript_6714/m.10792 type:complete len:147 (+) Transcript_6714:3160-3600(+)